MPAVIKSVKQSYMPTPVMLELLENFRRMVNDCIRIGLENDSSSMKKLSLLAYRKVSNYSVLNYYKLGAISRAAGILANGKKSLQRGIRTKNPYTIKVTINFVLCI